MLPRKFGVNWPFSSGEAKNRFSRWRPSWMSDRHDISYFWSQVTLMLPSKFGVNWPFGSGKEAKIRFSRWRPSWISERHNFSYFLSTSHPDASYQVLSQLAQGYRRSRHLKQLTPHNARRTMDDARRTRNDGRRTLTDHNSSPWALRAQVS